MRELEDGSEDFHTWDTAELQEQFPSRTAFLKAIILNENAAGAPSEDRTLREFWYEVVKIPLLRFEPEKSKRAGWWNRKASQALSAVLSEMVLDGELRYSDLGIVDDTRNHVDANGPFEEVIVFVEDHASFNKIQAVADAYRIWMIEGSGFEATALLEKLIGLLEIEGVDLLDTRFLVLGMTDYDAFGFKIFEDLCRRMEQLGMDIESERVGILPRDVETGRLDVLKFPIPVKCDYDNEWVERYGIGGPYGLELQAVGGERRRQVLAAALERHCPEKKLYDWLREQSWNELPMLVKWQFEAVFLGDIPDQFEQKAKELQDDGTIDDTRKDISNGTLRRRAEKALGAFDMSLMRLPTDTFNYIIDNCVEKYEIVDGVLVLTWKDGEAPDMDGVEVDDE